MAHSVLVAISKRKIKSQLSIPKVVLRILKTSERMANDVKNIPDTAAVAYPTRLPGLRIPTIACMESHASRIDMGTPRITQKAADLRLIETLRTDIVG